MAPPAVAHPGRASPASRLRDLLVVALPVQAAFLWVHYFPRQRLLMGDELRYFADGVRLAGGEALEPTFVWPPGQAWLLGASFALFGTSLVPVQLLQIASLWGGAFLLRSIARRMGLSPAAADLCLVSYACFPELVAFSHYLWPEVTHLFLALLAVRLVMEGRPWHALGAGASIGVALLLKSLLGPFVPIFLAAAAWPREGSPRPRAREPLLLLLGIAAVAGPLLVANGVRHGYWGIASSTAINAWVGLNDASRRNLVDEIVPLEMEHYLASSADPRERERLCWAKVREKVAVDGVAATVVRQLGKQYHRLLRRDSFFTDQLPGGASPGYAGISPAATWQLRAISHILYGLVIVTGILGLWAPRPRPMARAFLPFTLFLVGNLAMLLVLHVKTRYRLPLLPVMFLHAGVLWDVMAGIRDEPIPPWRPVAAVLTLGGALWLAFGS